LALLNLFPHPAPMTGRHSSGAYHIFVLQTVSVGLPFFTSTFTSSLSSGATSPAHSVSVFRCILVFHSPQLHLLVPCPPTLMPKLLRVDFFLLRSCRPSESHQLAKQFDHHLSVMRQTPFAGASGASSEAQGGPWILRVYGHVAMEGPAAVPRKTAPLFWGVRCFFFPPFGGLASIIASRLQRIQESGRALAAGRPSPRREERTPTASRTAIPSWLPACVVSDSFDGSASVWHLALWLCIPCLLVFEAMPRSLFRFRFSAPICHFPVSRCLSPGGNRWVRKLL